MDRIETVIAREVKVLTRKEVVLKAIEQKISWIQAADILGITARQMRRVKVRYEKYGYGGLRDYRGGKPRRKMYPDFSTKHFHEYAVEKHGLEISYNWARIVLEEAGIV